MVAITVRMQWDGQTISSYLADGNGDPIVFTDPASGMAWANTNRYLFEAEPGAVIVQGQFGLVSGENAEHLSVMFAQEGRAPCCLLDFDFVQDESDVNSLVDTRGNKISLVPDMKVYEGRMRLLPYRSR